MGPLFLLAVAVYLCGLHSGAAAFSTRRQDPIHQIQGPSWGVKIAARTQGRPAHQTASSALCMNLFDSVSKFLQDREGDFIKLEDSESAFGPGPLLLLYNVPLVGIDDDEYEDMLSDGAPHAVAKGVTIDHVGTDLMNLTVKEALSVVLSKGYEPSREDVISDGRGVPVLFFSGFANSEMMATYQIIGEQIYQQWGGTLTPACAKAVPNAMDKPFGQVLEEISGDHMHALSMEETEDTRM